jgi:3-oxoacyl-[acyl-carrier protein] reductase
MGALGGRVAFVAGAGRGIGRAVALAYAAEGAAVGCGARTRAEIDEVASAIAARGGRALATECDVTDEGSVLAAVDATASEFGGLDIMVANAGTMNPLTPIAETPSDEFRRVFDVNVMGVVHCAHAAVPRLRARGGGHIVVIGSGAGRRAGPGYGPYSASKAAAAMIVRILAQELRGDSIAVNELVPGPVMTQLAGFTLDIAHRPGGMFQGEWVKTPDDVAPLALFIATQPTNGPTGQLFSLLGRDM